MGHSDIEVTMNVYTHIGFEDATEELKKLEEARKVMEEDKENVKERRFKVI